MLFNESMTLGEKFLNSIAITILGVLIVFAVLAIIAFSIELLRIVFGENNKKSFVGNEESLKIVNENINVRKNIVQYKDNRIMKKYLMNVNGITYEVEVEELK